MLQMYAVLPRVRAPGIRIGPVNALPQVGQGTERGTGGIQDSTTEGIVQRIERRQVIVLGGGKQGSAAETILPGGDEQSLSEPSETAANHGVRTQLVSYSHARLELVI